MGCVPIIPPLSPSYPHHTKGHKIAKPQIMMIYFRKAEGYKTLYLINVKTISEAIRLYKTNLSVIKSK